MLYAKLHIICYISQMGMGEKMGFSEGKYLLLRRCICSKQFQVMTKVFDTIQEGECRKTEELNEGKNKTKRKHAHLSLPKVEKLGHIYLFNMCLVYILLIVVCPFVLFLWPLCCLFFDLRILFLWPLCCLFFDLRILINPSVSSNSSYL